MSMLFAYMAGGERGGRGGGVRGFKNVLSEEVRIFLLAFCVGGQVQYLSCEKIIDPPPITK